MATLASQTLTSQNSTITLSTKNTFAIDDFVIPVTVQSSDYRIAASITNKGTVTPSVTLDDSAINTYGFTTTLPSGETGINFLTINPDGSVTTQWNITPKLFVNGAGWIALNQGGISGNPVKDSPTIAAGTNYYVPVVSNSFSGGGISITTNYSKSDLAVTLATGTDSNMTNTNLGAKDTTNYPYYFKINGSTPAISGKTKATRAAATYTNSAGVIEAHSATQIWASSYVEPTVSVNAASGSTYFSLKKATMTVAGTNTVSPTASVAGSNATLNTTNNGISVTATGGGTASVTATATTNVAGFAPASTQLGSATLNAASNTTTATKYIAGVTLATGTAARTFTVTAPSGGTNHTYTFTQGTDGRTTIKVDNVLTMQWNNTTQALEFVYT